MSDDIRINGNTFSHGSIKIKFDGSVYHGLQSATFAHALAVKLIYGMGKHHAPRGRTRGKYTPEQSKVSGPINTMQAVRQQAADLSPDGKSYGFAEFDVTIQFAEENSSQAPHTIVLERCRLVGESGDFSEGEDESTEEITLSVMKIKRDGLYLFDTSEPAP